jgi:hypothetical protein
MRVTSARVNVDGTGLNTPEGIVFSREVDWRALSFIWVGLTRYVDPPCTKKISVQVAAKLKFCTKKEDYK